MCAGFLLIFFNYRMNTKPDRQASLNATCFGENQAFCEIPTGGFCAVHSENDKCALIAPRGHANHPL
ncbi:MAG TPA: hypothetical protein DD729_07180 [Rhodobacteraceae bacterium]|nr:hypothetical protein [Paracoccaceae bacterium]